MILRRFYDDGLAQASYLVGCAATGDALVVDPNRDADVYIEAARRERLRITHITETHIHADFMSGLRELRARTGATAYLSAEGGTDWQYAFADTDGAVKVRHGDTFMVGNIRIEVLHTPGHTPEHLTFMVTDTAGADQPMGAFTGDFIFAGDVGRPDLLEKAAGVAGTMDSAARQLFASLQAFKQRADYLQLWPGHGAGSACGKALGAVPQTTLGYERLFNWALTEGDEDAFVAAVLEGQPEPPLYFAEMKHRNRIGPALLSADREPAWLDPHALAKAVDADTLLIDTRPWSEYAREHVPGTISIPLNKSFITWAGWLIPYDRDFLLIVNDAAAAQRAVHELSMIGLDRVAGCFGWDAVTIAGSEGRTAAASETSVHELEKALDDAGTTILDVRATTEWEAGHLPATGGARVLHIPLGYLEQRIDEVPRGGRILVHCQAGSRSAIATSILERNGIGDAENVRGGFDSWRKAGLPEERGVDTSRALSDAV